MNFEILKGNINHILMLPKAKILKICEHMKQESNSNNSDISFKKQHQKINSYSII